MSIHKLRKTITPVEIRLLKLLAQGRINREIASELGIKEQTVKNELRFLFLKLGVANRTSAVIEALKKGLVKIR